VLGSVLRYCVGSGAPILVAALLCFAGVIMSASRAGFAATMCGIASLCLASLLMPRHGVSRTWASLGAAAAIVPLLLIVLLSGDTLASRVDLLLDAGTPDEIRLALWNAAHRMILDAPLLGLGLGTFQDAYPLYATRVFPFVMDKAHCDYLEFVAGIGLPAALAWFGAIAWLVARCIKGVRIRQRNQQYCIVALAASVLVAVHSSVDFSLQIMTS
jgi:O-antigen ligase